MLLDPICGQHMDPEKAPAFSTYKDHTYYFCCDEHKAQFDADPEKYLPLEEKYNPGYGDQCKAA